MDARILAPDGYAWAVLIEGQLLITSYERAWTLAEASDERASVTQVPIGNAHLC